MARKQEESNTTGKSRNRRSAAKTSSRSSARNGKQNTGRSRSESRGRRSGVIARGKGTQAEQRLVAPPKYRKGSMRIVPLGGLGEIGRNMNVVEYNGHILLIDCGVLFPEEEQPGVDLILPDFSYIKGRLDQVDALVLTHGHEDHIGGVPYLLKLRPDIPLIGSKLTLGFVDAKCEEHHLRPTEVEVKALPGLMPPRSGSTKSPSASAAKTATKKSTTPAQHHDGHRAQRASCSYRYADDAAPLPKIRV